MKRHSRQSRFAASGTNRFAMPILRNAAQWRTVAVMSSPFCAFIATATVALRPISVLDHFSFSSLRKSVISVSSASGASNSGPERRKSSSVASSSHRRANSPRPPFAASISFIFASVHISTRRLRRIARRAGEPGFRSSGFNFRPSTVGCRTIFAKSTFDARLPASGSSLFGSRLTTPSPNSPSPRSGSFGGAATSTPSSFR